MLVISIFASYNHINKNQSIKQKDKNMDMLAQFGYFTFIDPWACSLYGLIMLTLSVGLAFNLTKPEKGN